jgi:hypothetical protein
MPQAPKTRRRWYQFSLVSLFVLVTLLGIGFSDPKNKSSKSLFVSEAA